MMINTIDNSDALLYYVRNFEKFLNNIKRKKEKKREKIL